MAVLPDDYPEQIMTVLREALRPEVTISRPSPRSMTYAVRENGVPYRGGTGIAFLFSFPGGPVVGFLHDLFGRSAKEVTRVAVAEALRGAVEFCSARRDRAPLWATPLAGDVIIDVQERDDAVVGRIRGSVSGAITLSPVYLRDS